MALGSKRKAKSDDFVVDDDDSSDTRPQKKGKATGTGSEFQPLTKPKTDDEGDKYWEISKTRRVTVSEFKKTVMVNIREYYEKDGNMLPGKKGISMTVEQYSALVNIMPQLESLLAEKGQSVPRPIFDGMAAASDQKVDDDEDEEEDVDEKKANIDATSDEEE